MAISDKPGGSTKTVVRRASDGTTRVLNYPGLRYYNEKVVRSVNGVKPDQNGNVNTKGGAGSAQTKPSYWDDPLIHRIEIKPEDWKYDELSDPLNVCEACSIVCYDEPTFIPSSAIEPSVWEDFLTSIKYYCDSETINAIKQSNGIYANGYRVYYNFLHAVIDVGIDPSDGLGAELIFCNTGDIPESAIAPDNFTGEEAGINVVYYDYRPNDSKNCYYTFPSYDGNSPDSALLVRFTEIRQVVREWTISSEMVAHKGLYFISNEHYRSYYVKLQGPSGKVDYKLWLVGADAQQPIFPTKPIYLVVRESPDSTADSLYIPRDPNGPKGSPEDNGIGVEEEPEVTADVDGIAEAALKLATPRKIALTGEALGSGQFDGSKDVDIYTTVERITNSELEEALK